MRPRVFPAEDDIDLHEPILRTLASMRPRVFPAEDSGGGHPDEPVSRWLQ